jgi:peptidoglycan/LPS O-acetylase OafA/YrhL
VHSSSTVTSADPKSQPDERIVNGRIPSLDGLRAISIGLVFLGHLSGTRRFPLHSELLDLYANIGVRVFFIISGYLITTLLLREHAITSRINLRSFYRRRFFRIFPAAYAFITIAFVIWRATIHPVHFFAAATYTINYDLSRPWILGHLWSLSVEEQFYVLWPLVVVLFPGARNIVLTAIVLFTPITNAALIYFGRAGGMGLYFWTVSDALAIGCLLASLRLDGAIYQRVIQSRWLLFIPLTTLLLPVAFHHVRGLSILGGLTLMHLGIALTIDHCIRRRYYILNNPVICWMGTLSYSLYLWQQPFLNRESTAVWYTAFPANVLCASAFALLSYHLVERPMLRIGRRKITNATE